MDINIEFLIWFFVIALIANRLILYVHWQRKLFPDKDGFERTRLYYLGFFRATLMALIVVSIVSILWMAMGLRGEGFSPTFFESAGRPLTLIEEIFLTIFTLWT